MATVTAGTTILTGQTIDGDGGSATCNWVVNVTYVDSNSDGISDGWANHYFETTNIDPADDPDGDGLTNLQEFQEIGRAHV